MSIISSRNTQQFLEKALPVWDADHDNTLICCQIRNETHDVKSFFFQPIKPSLFQFLPGQFITLELVINGTTVNRCYTISSAPTRPHTISITVKRQPNGIVSNWLHDHLKVGSKISALGPAGDFTCTKNVASKYLFLSGGSGITPLMSMARTFHDLAEDADIAFVHSARSPTDIIFRHELDLMTFNLPHFHTAFVCEKIDNESNWTMPVGYLNIDALKTIAPDFLKREVFTCGPTPYMAAVRAMLKNASFDMQHYHEESFSFDELPASGQTETKTNTTEIDANKYKVEFSKSGTSFKCASDQFVLDAGIAAGMRLPSSCRKGLCGTCKSKLISGKVDMKHGGGIRPREIEQGLFLPCCSKPLSDLVIEK
jgi:glycine betaine catabolism B